jgi:NAD(P)-dependent dehydrogenase (short-subunit alcohol dehydrogenase family)
MSSSLENRVAVITGGASGIGEACARLMRDRGAKIVIADMNLEQAEAVAKSIGGMAVEMNVREPESITAGANKVEKDVGPADILVTSAGVAQFPAPAEDLTVDVWDFMQEVDLRGTWLSAVAFGKPMMKRGKGSIVTIGSITASRSVSVHSYAAAKRGVTSITESLATDWGRSGVRVNCVSPGFTLTPLMKSLFERKERDETHMKNDTALGRLVEPREIAQAAAFLASDEASAITGVNLNVDCGWLVSTSWHTYGGIRPPRT